MAKEDTKWSALRDAVKLAIESTEHRECREREERNRKDWKSLRGSVGGPGIGRSYGPH